MVVVPMDPPTHLHIADNEQFYLSLKMDSVDSVFAAGVTVFSLRPTLHRLLVV